jgi:environmental stress-induced protein Ves
MNLQRATSRAPMPWRNGKGVQYEIAADGPLPDGWTWRVSTADIDQDVPFSVYSGVVRDFCLAEGHGVVLTIDGVDHTCGWGSVTRFAGIADVSSRLIDGPVRALNLMQVESNDAGSWVILRAGESGPVSRVLVALANGTIVRVGSEEMRLESLDALLDCAGAVVAVASGVVATC